MKQFIIILIAISSTIAQFENFPHDADYVEVRDGAHMFYWLFYTKANVTLYTERPLMIWLQGGPGGSSTAIGNFQINGPLDQSLQERNYSWVNEFNVLYVDSPVGTGFSYVEDLTLLCTTDSCGGDDFVNLMRGFFAKHFEFQTVPVYIYGQSYGGKMAIDFALKLTEASRNGTIQIDLRGVAMGNAWIHPIYLTYGWGPFLYTAGLIDEDGLQAINASASNCEMYYNEGNYGLMMGQWSRTQWEVFQYTAGVDFYDITTKYPSNAGTRANEETVIDDLRKRLISDGLWETRDTEYTLNYLMNTLVREMFDIPNTVSWDSQSGAVFDMMAGDFMNPCTDGIERLLNETDMIVAKYQGNMDLICETAGQIRWVDELEWSGAEAYRATPRLPIWVQDRLEGYYKALGNFRFYWINKAGHSVPRDNPFGTSFFLQDMTGFGGY